MGATDEIAEAIGDNTQSIEQIRPQLGRVSKTFPQLRTRIEFFTVTQCPKILTNSIKDNNDVLVLSHPTEGLLDTFKLGGDGFDAYIGEIIYMQRCWEWREIEDFERGTSSPNVNYTQGQIQLTL